MTSGPDRRARTDGTAAVTRTPLAKRQVLSGLRCHKKLWLEVNEKEAHELEINDELRVRFAEGRVVGEEAQKHSGAGVMLAPHGDADIAKVATRTRDAMAHGESLLFEAGFIAAGAGIRADIMRREGDGAQATWSITEVKQSKLPEKERERDKKLGLHVADVAVQAWVAHAANVRVAASNLMLLNPACRHPDLSNLFLTTDVTARVLPVMQALPAAMATMQDVLRLEAAPHTPVGDQCTDPDTCEFYDRCHTPLPDHHVSELYYAKKLAKKLAADGKTMIADLTEADAPTPPAKRQVRSVKSGKRIVEPGLAAALGSLKAPIAYFDFETVQLAVPRWPGCGPQDLVAVQFSVHREGFADNTTRQFLARRGGDPRPALIDAMVEACAGAGSIVVYYEAFEKSRIKELAASFPERESELMDIHDRIVDLLPIVRDHVYDPEFHGSFSLKTVLPALVPDLTYKGLAIQEGMAATAAIYLMLFDDSMDQARQDALRIDLLAYCHRDTEAMVRLVAVLRALA